MRLTRVKQGEDASVYKAENGDIYILKLVDREYSGVRKKPVYYLDRKKAGSKKAEYISGLFSTQRAGVFSLDVKDNIGMKVMYTMSFENGGQVAILEKGKAREKNLVEAR